VKDTKPTQSPKPDSIPQTPITPESARPRSAKSPVRDQSRVDSLSPANILANLLESGQLQPSTVDYLITSADMPTQFPMLSRTPTLTKEQDASLDEGKCVVIKLDGQKFPFSWGLAQPDRSVYTFMTKKEAEHLEEFKNRPAREGSTALGEFHPDFAPTTLFNGNGRACNSNIPFGIGQGQVPAGNAGGAGTNNATNAALLMDENAQRWMLNEQLIHETMDHATNMLAAAATANGGSGAVNANPNLGVQRGVSIPPIPPIGLHVTANMGRDMANITQNLAPFGADPSLEESEKAVMESEYILLNARKEAEMLDKRLRGLIKKNRKLLRR